jgi:hypothetical protein
VEVSLAMHHRVNRLDVRVLRQDAVSEVIRGPAEIIPGDIVAPVAVGHRYGLAHMEVILVLLGIDFAEQRVAYLVGLRTVRIRA